MLLLNNKPVEYFYFPGGEIQVKLPLPMQEERAIITWKPTKPDHIILLGLVVNALNNMSVFDIEFDILYLPYARQDRVCAPGESFSLEFICQYLVNLDPVSIRIWDIHNVGITAKLFEKTDADVYIWHFSACDIFKRYNVIDNFDLNRLVLCAPDKGASNRMIDIADEYKINSQIFLDKSRNPYNGHIEGISLHYSTIDLRDGHDILIIDDICDGGRTFIETAKFLKSLGKNSLYLYVTHGIFSQGLEELEKYFTHIFCHHVLDDEKYFSNKSLTVLRSFKNEPIILH